jgi:hypothetical protein
MASHDLLVLNNSSDTSKTYIEARNHFVEEDMKEYVDRGSAEDYLLDTGFEYGFWAAVRILTGYKAEYEN